MAAPAPSAEQLPTFRVLLLGSFGLFRDGEPVDTGGWPRSAATLFKLLAVAPEWRRSRDELMELLWPEAAPDAAASNLRSALHRLRNGLGRGDPSPVIFERGWIALNRAYDWEIDLERFDELMQSARGDARTLEGALDLYRGEALVEDRYEDWAGPVRERTQRAWRDGSLELAELLEEQGAYGRAVAVLEPLLESDPLDEAAARILVRALGKAGRRTEALRRYQQLEAQLHRELGLHPEPETAAVADQIKAQPESAPAVAPAGVEAVEAQPEQPLPVGGFLGALPAGPLVAREDECARILFVLDVVEEGAGRLLLLAGERGVGKTRLAQETFLQLRDRGFLVAAGRCYERGQDVAFHPFHETFTTLYQCAPPDFRSQLRQRRPHLTRILLERQALPIGGPEGHIRRHSLLLETADFVNTLAARRPVGLLLDDLHWADQASLDLLWYLAQHTRRHPTLLLGTYCDAGVDGEHRLGRMVRELDRDGLVERLAVRRLTEDGTAALVSAGVGETDGAEDFAEHVHRRTKGNPFFIQKILCSLGGRYRLVRQIGSGGMGRVFEAVDTVTGETVAAKLMFSRTEADPDALRRFQQEGAVLERLDHPNIVNVHGTFLDEHSSCIVMERLEGESLGAMLRRQQDGRDELSLPYIRQLMGQVATALGYAHRHGIVHRDVKPDNIMVLEGGHIKVTDFGIARLLRPGAAGLSTMTSTGMTLGTPLYMAPEQIGGKKVDGRADVYSLGAVLYQLVTGRAPFEEDDPMVLALKHVQEKPVPPGSLNRDLPAEWERLIMKALAKDPAQRFQTAEAMGEAIERLTTGEEPLGEQPSAELSQGRSLTGALRSVAELKARVQAAPKRTVGALVAGVVATLLVAIGAVAAAWHAGSTAPARPGFGSTATIATAQFGAPAGVAVDRSGNVYVSDRRTGRIEKFSPNGKPLGVVGGTGSKPGQFVSPDSLTVDGQGNIFVVDTGNDRVQELSPAGEPLAYWGTSGLGPGQLASPQGVGVDGHGTIYVTDLAGSGRTQALAGGGASTGARWQATTPDPKGVAIGPGGNLYVAVADSSLVEILTPKGGPVRSIGGQGPEPGHFEYPEGVALDRQGNIYVTDSVANHLQKFSASGKPLVRWGTTGSLPGQFRSPSGVAVDARGNLYVADTGNHRVQKLSPEGRPLGVWGARGPASALVRSKRSGLYSGPLFGELAGLALDAAGNIYVANNHDMSSVNAIRPSFVKLSPRGAVLAEWGNPFVPSMNLGGIAVGSRGIIYIADRTASVIEKLAPGGRTLARWDTGFGSDPLNVAVDGDGNVYVADGSGNRIEKFSPGGRRLAVWGKEGSGPGEFRAPIGVALDSRGNVYVADANNARIQKLSPSGRPLAQWGTFGAATGQFEGPQGIALDARGYIYVADLGNDRVQKLSPAGKPVAQWRVPHPGALVVDQAGALYVTDTADNRVEKLSPTGQVLGIWRTNGSFASLPKPQMPPSTLDNPNALAVDPRGEVYVANFPQSSAAPYLVKLSAAGRHSASWQLTAPSFGIAVDRQGDLLASDPFDDLVQKVSPSGKVMARWNVGNGSDPRGIAVDAQGAIYVVDFGNDRIDKLSPSGARLAAWGGDGSEPGKFTGPQGVAVDSRGNIYVSELLSASRIQRLSPTGRPSGLWGILGAGPGQFDSPMGVAVDAGGDMYVADTNNDRVQKLSSTGKVLAVWGGAKGQSLRFKSPSAVALDGQGRVYVADSGNNRVVKLSPQGRVLAIWK